MDKKLADRMESAHLMAVENVHVTEFYYLHSPPPPLPPVKVILTIFGNKKRDRNCLKSAVTESEYDHLTLNSCEAESHLSLRCHGFSQKGVA